MTPDEAARWADEEIKKERLQAALEALNKAMAEFFAPATITSTADTTGAVYVFTGNAAYRVDKNRYENISTRSTRRPSVRRSKRVKRAADPSTR